MFVFTRQTVMISFNHGCTHTQTHMHGDTTVQYTLPSRLFKCLLCVCKAASLQLTAASHQNTLLISSSSVLRLSSRSKYLGSPLMIPLQSHTHAQPCWCWNGISVKYMEWPRSSEERSCAWRSFTPHIRVIWSAERTVQKHCVCMCMCACVWEIALC